MCCERKLMFSTKTECGSKPERDTMWFSEKQITKNNYLRENATVTIHPHTSSFWQSRPPGEWCHHQHQRRANRLSQRCHRCHKAGRYAASGGEARERGHHTHHRPGDDRPLTSRLTGQPVNPPDLNQSTNPEPDLSVFQPIRNALKNQATNRGVCLGSRPLRLRTCTTTLPCFYAHTQTFKGQSSTSWELKLQHSHHSSPFSLVFPLHFHFSSPSQFCIPLTPSLTTLTYCRLPPCCFCCLFFMEICLFFCVCPSKRE